MRETMFDDSYNIREVLDDVIERVTLREKLISTAKQFAEKKREDRYTLAIKQFENLMGDFLRLYQPILDRLGSYRQGLQKELTGLKSSLATVTGMLEVSKGIEGLQAKVQRLEADGQDLDKTIKEKGKTADKIDDLFNRIRTHYPMFYRECRRICFPRLLRLRKKLPERHRPEAKAQKQDPLSLSTPLSRVCCARPR